MNNEKLLNGIARIGDALGAIREALAAQPAEPETPDRTGQWFVHRRQEHLVAITGKPIRTNMGRLEHPVSVSQFADGWTGGVLEVDIQDGTFLRIPTRPNDKVTECREPKGDEQWYTLSGKIALPNWKTMDVPPVGRRRWIEPQPCDKCPDCGTRFGKTPEPLAKELPIEQVEKELADAGIDGISFKQAGKMFKQIADLTEVCHWAQAVLTAWNIGPLPQESPLHKKLRDVMINYRRPKEEPK